MKTFAKSITRHITVDRAKRKAHTLTTPFRPSLTTMDDKDWAHAEALLNAPPRDTKLTQLLATPTAWERNHLQHA